MRLVKLASLREAQTPSGCTVSYLPLRLYAVPPEQADAWEAAGVTLPLPEGDMAAERESVDTLSRRLSARALEDMAADLGISAANVTAGDASGKPGKRDWAQAIALRQREQHLASERRVSLPESAGVPGNPGVFPAFAPVTAFMCFPNSGRTALLVRNDGEGPVDVVLYGTATEHRATVAPGVLLCLPALPPATWNVHGRATECSVDFSVTEGVSAAALRLTL